MRELERLGEEPGQTVPKIKKGKKATKNGDMARFDGNEEEDEAKSRALNGQDDDDDDSDSDTDTDEDEEKERTGGKKRKKGKRSQQATPNEAGSKSPNLHKKERERGLPIQFLRFFRENDASRAGFGRSDHQLQKSQARSHRRKLQQVKFGGY